MIDTLATNPVALAFLAIAVGAVIGAIKIKGVSLGAAGALFAGLFLGALDPRLATAPGLNVLRTFGLAFFTYTLGLASGPSFVQGVRRGGAKALAATTGLVVVGAWLAALGGWLIGGNAADKAGLFAGATTNTPALDAAIEALKTQGHTGNPVVAYSLTYPFAVLVMILVQQVVLSNRTPVLRTTLPDAGAASPMVAWTVEVTGDDQPTLGELRQGSGGAVTFSRVQPAGGRVQVATDDVRLSRGDLVMVIGPEPAVEALTTRLGRRSDLHLALDRHDIDFRRMLVSNHKVAGARLGDLGLTSRFGATVTRVRRGDTDHLAGDDWVLALGDRVRVVGPVERLPDVARLLGDSDRELSEVDFIGFAVGVTAGLLLGLVRFPLPGDVHIVLGAAGGPLIVGLVLGTITRVGPVTFQLPHATNLVFRQLGVVAFLAVAGLASGTQFWDAVRTRTGLELAATGTAVAAVFALTIALAASVLLRQSPTESSGLIAGVNTQPAALQFATLRTDGDDRVGLVYALVFPAAMIVKIIVVQFLV